MANPNNSHSPSQGTPSSTASSAGKPTHEPRAAIDAEEKFVDDDVSEEVDDLDRDQTQPKTKEWK